MSPRRVHETGVSIRRSPANGVPVFLIIATALFAGSPEAREMQVEVSGDAVSVRARDVPVRDLIEEIAGQADLVISLDDPLLAPANIEFQHLPLAVAIRRILGDHGFVLEYAPVAGAAARPHRLWVLSSGPEESSAIPSTSPRDNTHQRLQWVSALYAKGGDEATRALAAAALNDADRAVRREAVHALGEIAGESGIETLEQALMDADRGVRLTAAAAFGEIGGDHSARALAAALDDEDPAVRQEAVDSLGEIGGPTAGVLLRQALDDDHRAVREAAAENLAELPEPDQ